MLAPQDPRIAVSTRHNSLVCMCVFMSLAVAPFPMPVPFSGGAREGLRVIHHRDPAPVSLSGTFALQSNQPLCKACGLHKDPISDLDEKALYP